MQSICVLDSHELCTPTEHPQDSQGNITALAWLGTPHSVLAVIQNNTATLVSLAPLAHGTHHQPYYHSLGWITTDFSITAIAASQSLCKVLVTNSNADVICYQCTLSTRAQAQPLWSHRMSTPQHLLDVCPTTESCAASSAPNSPAIAVWHFSLGQASAKQYSVESIRTPSPSTCLAFRPDTCQRRPMHAARSSPVASVLMAVGADGCVRIWVDMDLANTLPQKIVSEAGAAEPARRAFCLSHVLVPPAPLSQGPRLLAVSWADPSGIRENRSICQHHRVAWLVATRAALDSAALDGQLQTGSSREPDHAGAERLEELFVWAVSVDAGPQSHEGNVSSTDGAASHLGQLGRNAGCQTPRVGASLWSMHCLEGCWRQGLTIVGSSTTKKLHLMQLAAVTECEGTPVLQVAHAALRTNVPSEVRTAVVALAHASKVSDGLDGLGRLQRGLALHLACPCPLTPTVPNMTALQVHATQKLAVTVSLTGQLSVWQTEPLALVAAASIGSKSNLPARFLAAAWLPHMPKSIAAAPLLALAADNSLHLVRVQADASVIVLASADILEDSSAVTTVQMFAAGEVEGPLVVVRYSRGGKDESAAETAVFAVVDSNRKDRSSLGLVPLGDCGLRSGWLGISKVAGDSDMVVAATVAASELQIALFVLEQRRFVRCATGSAERLSGTNGAVPEEDVHEGRIDVHGDLRAMVAAAVFSASTAQLVIWKLLEASEGFQAEAALVQQVPVGPASVRCLPPAVATGGVALCVPRQVIFFGPVATGWAPLATVGVPGTPHSLVLAHDRLFVGLRGQIAAFKPVVQLRDGPEDMNVLEELLHTPLPLWHPSNLAAFLLCGAHSVAARLVREQIRVVSGAQKHAEPELIAGALHAICSPLNGIADTFKHACERSISLEAAAVKPGKQVMQTGQHGIAAALHDEFVAAVPKWSSTHAARDTAHRSQSGQVQSIPDQSLHPQMGSHAEVFEKASEKSPRKIPAVSGKISSAPVSGKSLTTGQLDMSSFAAFSAPPHPQPTHGDLLQSSQLDMSSFAAFSAPQDPQPVISVPLQTGQLDMSSFAVFSAPPGPQAAQKDQSRQVGTPCHSDPTSEPSQATTGHVQPGTQNLSPRKGVQTAASSDRGQPSVLPLSHDPLQTGQLDMSMFGGFMPMAAPSESLDSPVPENQLQSSTPNTAEHTGTFGGPQAVKEVSPTHRTVCSGPVGEAHCCSSSPFDVLTAKDAFLGSPGSAGQTAPAIPVTACAGLQADLGWLSMPAQCEPEAPLSIKVRNRVDVPFEQLQFDGAQRIHGKLALDCEQMACADAARWQESAVCLASDVSGCAAANQCGRRCPGHGAAAYGHGSRMQVLQGSAQCKPRICQGYCAEQSAVCVGALTVQYPRTSVAPQRAGAVALGKGMSLAPIRHISAGEGAVGHAVVEGCETSTAPSRQSSTKRMVRGAVGEGCETWIAPFSRNSAAKGGVAGAVAEGWEAEKHKEPKVGGDGGVLEMLRCPGRGEQSPINALQHWQELEEHCCARQDCLTDDEIDELRDLTRDSEASKCKDAGIDFQAAQLLPALAAAFCSMSGASDTPEMLAEELTSRIRALDLPGRRMTSAVRLGSVLLQNEWAAAERNDTRQGDEDGPSGPSSQRSLPLSSSAQKLLQRMRGGDSKANLAPSASTQMLTQRMAGEPKASTTLTDTPTSSDSFFDTHSTMRAMPSPAPPLESVPWAQLGLLPTLQPAAILWAFDCNTPLALLETLLLCMPRAEPQRDANSAGNMTSAFADSLRRVGTQDASKAWTWANLRRVGASLWLQEAGDAAAAAERIAKATFAASRDACAVALWYCALQKHSVLAGLMRASGDARVAAFFTKDFHTPEARAAAAKNAHKLLSQHRYTLAVAFFLCAGDTDAALSTCLDYLHDAQLALFVARVLDAVRPGSGQTAALLQRLLVASGSLQSGSFIEAVLLRASGHTAVGNLKRVFASGEANFVAASGQLQAMDWVAYSLLKHTGRRADDRGGSSPTLPALGELQELARALPALASRAADSASNGGVSVASLRAALLGVRLHEQESGHYSRGQAARALALKKARRRAAVIIAYVVLASAATGPLRLRHGDGPTDSARLAEMPNQALKETAARMHSACLAAAGTHSSSIIHRLSEDIQGLGKGLVEEEGAVVAVLGELRTCMEQCMAAAAPSEREAAVPILSGRSAENIEWNRGAEARRRSSGHGELLNAAASRVLATVGDKDAQAVAYSGDTSSTAANVAIATKKQGLMFCNLSDEQPSLPSARHLQFSHLFEEIVGEWHPPPGQGLPSPRLPAIASMLHPHQAQRLQRMQLVNPSPGTCVAQALTPNPRHATFLSGSAPGYVHCWSFVDRTLRATYAPLPMSRSLLSRAGGGSAVPHPQQVAHWGYVTDITVNAAGTRFAAVGKGGWVCLWRLDAVWADTVHGCVGCCDWAHRCLDKQGDAIAFVGGKSGLLLVGGRSAGNQDLSVWDILVPLPRACVAVAPSAQSVNDVVLAADQVTALVAMQRGGVAAYDLRKLGPARVDVGADLMRRERQQGVLWAHERAHDGAATCAAVCQRDFCPPGFPVDIGATGGRDGRVIVWDVKTGVEVQLLPALHWTHGRGLFGFGSTEKVGCKVKSLAFSELGLVSASQSTSVLHTPWH